MGLCELGVAAASRGVSLLLLFEGLHGNASDMASDDVPSGALLHGRDATAAVHERLVEMWQGVSK